MEVQLLSVNAGKERTQPKGNMMETTGIYKMPISGPVHIGELGIADDFICDHKNHGGPDQAIYIYSGSDYEWWSRALGYEPTAGTFGENLTISELESAACHVGDRLEIGSVELEFTAPRIPCSTLAARMRDPQFVKKYRHGEKPGVYCRVIRAGTVQAGDTGRLVPFAGPTVTMLDIFRDHYARHRDVALVRRIREAPVAIRTRAAIEHALSELGERP